MPRRATSRHLGGFSTPRKSAAVGVLPLLLVTALAFAQMPSGHRQMWQPGVGPSPVQAGEAAARQGTRARGDADARECLENLTNTGVIRCAERYRHPPARPAR
jgi:hypothetical protein